MPKTARQKLNRRGYTLIELVLVMAVITLLVGLSVPTLATYNRNSRQAQMAKHEELVDKALRQYYAYEGAFPDLTDLDPADGDSELTSAQAGELKDALQTVTTTRINITDYQITYNEQTGWCRLELK